MQLQQHIMDSPKWKYHLLEQSTKAPVQKLKRGCFLRWDSASFCFVHFINWCAGEPYSTRCMSKVFIMVRRGGWHVSWMKVPQFSLGLSACYQVSLQLFSPTSLHRAAATHTLAHKNADKSKYKNTEWWRYRQQSQTLCHMLSGKSYLN